MAKLGKNIIFEVGDDGLIEMRHPTNEEWNDYQANKIEAQSEGRDIPALNKVICDFFDKLIVKIENIEDSDDTPITLENLGRISIKEKTSMIMQGIELNSQGISIKNS